ncbi:MULTISPECIES: hypothetical protein [unclassified Streptomyces]|uniref:hypothetical protein n=1 Tax=unclassified Streptomyces TaxID=2593676 RepID=UPI002DDBC2DB|nr:hypothetical protein [Streptomyces sp. NBC_01766]WSC21766.1 hypothetical protein OIE60_19920 [Streptomyces sp. NBC_01766]WSV55724.1 hypothetical protein OG282_19590 [Streptomyces sp. NBC_01014]
MTTATNKDHRSEQADSADGHPCPRPGPHPGAVDIAEISAAIADALSIRLSPPDRQAVHATTLRLRRALHLFMSEDLGYETDPAALEMYRAGRRLLDLTGRSADGTPYSALYEMSELARLAKRFIRLYRERHP